MSKLGKEELEGELGLSRRAAIEWHLQNNFYPPVHPAFAENAEQAISACMANDWSRPITLVNGRESTASSIVTELRLDSWIDFPFD